jgi:hypothetical protein
MIGAGGRAMGDERARGAEHALVRALLAAQGIHPGEDDLAAIAAGHAALRERAALLYTVECGDGDPAPLLRAREPGAP